ncbi:hypothetical protein PVK06_005482 [Gossypium arboreum]|uniref:Uncharacterized protein n=1 Tax=Gossypium arboreum TaxID=29729 RepID=A0ABR0QVZ6_GOSAR|nr:hypothetical protein PVK06_005482 [Gossypium arboreum]
MVHSLRAYNHSLNGYMPLVNTTEAISRLTRPSDVVSPYKAFDDLAAILVERKYEPLNFFYSYYRLCILPWSIPPTRVVGFAQSSTPSQNSNNMDVDAIIEKALKVVDDTDAKMQVADSNRKRPVTSERESTLPIPLARHETQAESVTTLADVCPLTQSLLGTLTPLFFPFMPLFLAIRPRHPLGPSIETLEFKYNSLKIESEGRVHQLEEQIKAQEEQWLVDLEKIQKENIEALAQFKAGIEERIMDYLPKLKSNYIFHAHVAWALSI